MTDAELDAELVEECRKAANNLAAKLETASANGLILSCSVAPSGSSHRGQRLTKQFNWYAEVQARREVLL